MRLTSDARTVLALLRGMRGRGSHADDLAAFYGPQADSYDAFRERLLHGRQPLIDALPLAPGSRVVELGAGTGRNLDYIGPRLDALASIELVDLCGPLLHIARGRAAGVPNARVVQADAATYQPPHPVDCVYLSYALTMMPDWRAVVQNAAAMLRPGGVLGVADFYISSRVPAVGLARHGWLTRTLWPRWFRHDGVRLSDEHLPYLRSQFETVHLDERRSAVPYVPLATVPTYVFVGRKHS